MERRKEPRYKINAAAEVRLRYGTSTINAEAVEISTHGVKIESADLIEPGTRVEAVLFLREPEKISGEVKWVLAKPWQGTVNYKMGISCDSGAFMTDKVS